MPHVGPLKDEEGAKCPFAKQQSPTEEISYSMAWRPGRRHVTKCNRIIR